MFEPKDIGMCRSFEHKDSNRMYWRIECFLEDLTENNEDGQTSHWRADVYRQMNNEIWRTPIWHSTFQIGEYDEITISMVMLKMLSEFMGIALEWVK